nr:MAG TPA: hypothetical protein [Caudoviricetes sp.]
MGNINIKVILKDYRGNRTAEEAMQMASWREKDAVLQSLKRKYSLAYYADIYCGGKLVCRSTIRTSCRRENLRQQFAKGRVPAKDLWKVCVGLI